MSSSRPILVVDLELLEEDLSGKVFRVTSGLETRMYRKEE
jgi:hypothetical protein